MEILICGSAAGEGIPSAFCRCRVCRNARKSGGFDARTRTAYQIGEEVRIDFGPDFLAQEIRLGFDSEKIRHLFITHDHADHFYPETLNHRRPAYSKVAPGRILKVYCNEAVERAAMAHPVIGEGIEILQMEFVRLKAWEPVVLREERMTLTPLPAYHAPEQEAFFFDVRSDSGEEWLIANDTGFFSEPVWEWLGKRKFDGVILDCTFGLLPDDYPYHMGAGKNLLVLRRMRECGMLKPDARVVANHFSHNCGNTHRELYEFFKPYGIETGYDGMRLESLCRCLAGESVPHPAGAYEVET